MAFFLKKAVLLLKTINYPVSNSYYQNGTIDIWLIVHDGGHMLQIGYLLSLNRVWKNCKLRLFTTAGFNDNSIKIKEDLETYLKLLRIDAQVKVIEMVSVLTRNHTNTDSYFPYLKD